jgi:outer membrane lipoprotein SlyB
MSDQKDSKQDAKLATPAQESGEIESQSIAGVSKDIAMGAAKGAAKGAVKGAIAGAIEGATEEARKAAVTAQNNAEIRKQEDPAK